MTANVAQSRSLTKCYINCKIYVKNAISCLGSEGVDHVSEEGLNYLHE
jgi:hypothetical protein